MAPKIELGRVPRLCHGEPQRSHEIEEGWKLVKSLPLPMKMKLSQKLGAAAFDFEDYLELRQQAINIVVNKEVGKILIFFFRNTILRVGKRLVKKDDSPVLTSQFS